MHGRIALSAPKLNTGPAALVGSCGCSPRGRRTPSPPPSIRAQPGGAERQASLIDSGEAATVRTITPFPSSRRAMPRGQTSFHKRHCSMNVSFLAHVCCTVPKSRLQTPLAKPSAGRTSASWVGWGYVGAHAWRRRGRGRQWTPCPRRSARWAVRSRNAGREAGRGGGEGRPREPNGNRQLLRTGTPSRRAEAAGRVSRRP